MKIKSLLCFFLGIILFVNANAQTSTTADQAPSVLTSISGELRLGDLCVNDGIMFNHLLSSSERLKYGTFKVYKALYKTDLGYFPGDPISATVSFGKLNGSAIPFTISRLSKSVDRVIIVFNAQGNFFENTIRAYTFNSENIQVTNAILQASRPFIVPVACTLMQTQQ